MKKWNFGIHGRNRPDYQTGQMALGSIHIAICWFYKLSRKKNENKTRFDWVTNLSTSWKRKTDKFICTKSTLECIFCSNQKD